MKPKKKIKDKIETLSNDIVEELYNEFEQIQTNEYITFQKNLKYIIDIFNMKINIVNHNTDIWCPEINIKEKNIQTNSWFKTKKSETYSVPFKNNKYKCIANENKPKYKSKQITLILTEHQKIIINDWLNCSIDMYNKALEYIKLNINTDKKVLNFMYLRDKLYNEKHKIIKNSSIKVHDIDLMIKLICTNYKSAITNYKNGNIKNFRIRNWNKNKDNKLMYLEKNNFKNNTIRKQILGTVKGYYNNKEYNFNDIDCDCTLMKTKIGGYFLIVPELLEDIFYEKENNILAVDMGSRTFCTGITKNNVLEIGTNVTKKISKCIKRKERIMKNKEIDKKIKKKNERVMNKKINNMVNDLHWKTIDFMTKIANTILIGDINSKSIISKKNNLPKIVKKIITALSFYKFKTKLIYKCLHKDIHLLLTNEWMTSKMCSCCGEINEKLGRKKIFNCDNCKLKIDRDINGARNIYIKSIC